MEFILTFLIVFLGIGWILKRLFPILLAWYVKRKMKNGGGTFCGFGPFGGVGGFGSFGGFDGNTAWEREQEQARRRKSQEGKVTVEKGEEKEKVIDKNIGEYIDFEEEK